MRKEGEEIGESFWQTRESQQGHRDYGYGLYRASKSTEEWSLNAENSQPLFFSFQHVFSKLPVKTLVSSKGRSQRSNLGNALVQPAEVRGQRKGWVHSYLSKLPQNGLVATQWNRRNQPDRVINTLYTRENTYLRLEKNKTGLSRVQRQKLYMLSAVFSFWKVQT